MYTTIGLAVEAGRKAINEQLGVGASGKQVICAEADAKTIASRISWGCAQAMRRPGAANMTASQQREYSRGYKRGYLSAWGAAAVGKNVLGGVDRRRSTVASMGWSDGAEQGAADAASMSKRGC